MSLDHDHHEVVRYISTELADSLLGAAKPLHLGPESLVDPPQPDFSRQSKPGTLANRYSHLSRDTNFVRWIQTHGYDSSPHKCP